MKIGDIYYCIKNRYDVSDKLVHKKGKNYKVLVIENNTVILETEKFKSINSFFYVVDDSKGFYYYYFYTYFATLQKIRSIKLKKLYESSL